MKKKKGCLLEILAGIIATVIGGVILHQISNSHSNTIAVDSESKYISSDGNLAIPKIHNLPYESARKKLIELGWMPNLVPWQMAHENGGWFLDTWEKFPELVTCIERTETCKFTMFSPNNKTIYISTSTKNYIVRSYEIQD